MSGPSPTPIAAPGTPQVLLFGHSGAGKSALLGALFQTGEKQGEILLGEVLEPTGRLESLRDATYGGVALEQTHTELISYLIRIRPWRDGTRALTDPFSIVLHDCSGKAAGGLLRHPDALRDPQTRSIVARAVLETDAIILLVDAAADDKELTAAFHEFEAFLGVVGLGKAAAREVGGFPVFLVLTQCDKLAVASDTRASWEARVNEQAEHAWKQFHNFLKDATHEGEIRSRFLPFGSIELEVAAVATRTPRLLDAPGQPGTPYQVAELFRDTFAAARAHRSRTQQSDRRLWWTARSAFAFVAALMLSAAAVVILQPQDAEAQLASRVRAYRMSEEPAGVRLSEPELTRNKQLLLAIREDPRFPSLGTDLQDYVEGRLKEIADYEAYARRLESATAPGDTRSLEELARVERALRADLAWPPEYAWDETPAGKLREKWLTDARAIRATELLFLQRYQDFVRRGLNLTLTKSFGGSWRADVGGLLAEADHPPAVLTDPVPGSPVLGSPRGEPVTNRVPYEFDGVYEARRDWDATRDRLTHLRDFADALGLTEGPGRPEPVLALPETAGGVDPAARLAALERQYKPVAEDIKNWSLAEFPEPARGILAAQLDHHFKAGVRTVQGLIVARLRSDRKRFDTPEGWRAVAKIITDAGSPFPNWGRLLHAYVSLKDPNAADPVLELATFLQAQSFDMTLSGFELVIPVDLALEKVVPTGPLTMTITHAESKESILQFKQDGEGVRKESNFVYRFTAQGDGNLTYIPGEGLKIGLPVRAGDQNFRIEWDATYPKTFQFGAFDREPRLLRPGGSSEPALGVRFTPSVESKVPRFPVLFPDLR